MKTHGADCVDGADGAMIQTLGEMMLCVGFVRIGVVVVLQKNKKEKKKKAHVRLCLCLSFWCKVAHEEKKKINMSIWVLINSFSVFIFCPDLGENPVASTMYLKKVDQTWISFLTKMGSIKNEREKLLFIIFIFSFTHTDHDSSRRLLITQISQFSFLFWCGSLSVLNQAHNLVLVTVPYCGSKEPPYEYSTSHWRLICRPPDLLKASSEHWNSWMPPSVSTADKDIPFKCHYNKFKSCHTVDFNLRIVFLLLLLFCACVNLVCFITNEKQAFQCWVQWSNWPQIATSEL